MIQKEELKKYLNDPTIQIMIQDSLDSTNNYAAGLPHKRGEKAVIIARKQTGGKGTKGRSFYCGANEGLYLSLLFHPTAKAEKMMLATPAAAVAVSRAIEDVAGIKTGIKWVNDIVIEDKKLCGILSEARVMPGSDMLEYLIIGIGINLNVKEFPAQIAERAASLHQYAKNIDANKLCGALINYLDSSIESIDTPDFMQAYRERSSLLNRHVIFEWNGDLLEGTAVDINDAGNLMVVVKGILYTLTAGDVSVKLG